MQPEIDFREGALTLPDGPGLGYTVDEASLERYTVARWGFAA
jgi:L-alanine-DL-glutamate epimerase-like enolase superfamily enzyme